METIDMAAASSLSHKEQTYLSTDLFNLILASTSSARHALLVRAGIVHDIAAARIDEAAARDALVSEGASHRDIADALAEMKARKIAEKNPGCLVLGCDQILSFDNSIFSKPGDKDAAVAQLHQLQGHTHQLYTAMVLYENARPVWRHIAEARITMRKLTSSFISHYVEKHWDDIRHCVGCYRIEEEGIQLFSAVQGEQTAIQGLPLPPLLGYLADRGLIAA